MSNTSFSKQVARYTKSLRVSLGLAGQELRTQADGRVEPFLLTRNTPSARLRAVETDLARLTHGWNQHIPQLLSVAAEARVRAHEAAGSNPRLDEMEAGLKALKGEVAKLEAQISTLRANDGPVRATSTRPSPPAGSRTSRKSLTATASQTDPA